MISKKTIILFELVFCFQVVAPLDINHIRDTYSILSDEYKHCSPIHGAVWIETQLLKKYYKFGDQDDSTVKLIKELFYIIVDSFGITNNVGKPAYHFSPAIVGNIIGTIENHKNKQKDLADAIKKIISEDEHFKKSNADVGNKPRSTSSYVKKLSEAIVGSLAECGFWKRSEKIVSYSPYTTHAVLLGFLYKKASKKNELRSYFQAIQNSITNGLFSVSGKSMFEQTAWDSSCFDKNIADSIITACGNQASKNILLPFFNAVKQALSNKYDPFEAIVFAEIIKQFYSQSIPQIICRNAGGHGTINFEGRPFNDCTEVTIRDLCNIVVFNQDQLKFIPLETDNLKPSPELMQYYQGVYADATKHLSSKTFQVWGDLVENMPGVIYAAMCSKNHSERYERLIHGNDIFYSHLAQPVYLVLSKEDINSLPTTIHGNRRDLNVGNEPYIVGDSNQYKTYALWPSLKNIIILLNRLFGLNLYNDHLVPFKDFHFCSKYFPILCERLGWDYSAPGINLDAPYFQWNNTIPMHLAKNPSAKWNLFIKWHHAEVQSVGVPSYSKISMGYKDKLFNGLLKAEESLESYDLMALYVPEAQNILNVFKSVRSNVELKLNLKLLNGALSNLRKKLSSLKTNLGDLSKALK